MAVLVTGGAGYIGSHMVLALLDTGHEVVVLDNLVTGFRDAVPAQAKFVEGDVSDAENVATIIRDFGVREIVHFAASVVVPDSMSDPLGYYLNNTIKTRSLIQCAIEGGVERFVFSSTAAVYGNPVTSPVNEAAALAPISPYGWSKAMSERMLIDACAVSDMKYVILRYFNVAGADLRGRSGQRTRSATHLIKVACEAAVGRREGIAVFGADYPTRDGTCVRDYIHVSDLAAAHLAALSKLRESGESMLMNCGYGRGLTVKEVLEAVSAIAPCAFAIVEEGRRPGDPADIVADATRIRETLDWTPQYDDLAVIVRSALAFEQRQLDRQA